MIGITAIVAGVLARGQAAGEHLRAAMSVLPPSRNSSFCSRWQDHMRWLIQRERACDQAHVCSLATRGSDHRDASPVRLQRLLSLLRRPDAASYYIGISVE